MFYINPFDLNQMYNLGRAIGDYRTQRQLQLMYHDPLRQAQAEMYKAQALYGIPAEAEWRRALATMAIPAEQELTRVRTTQEIPALAEAYRARALLAPAEAEFLKKRTEALEWEKIDPTWLADILGLIDFNKLLKAFGLNY